MNRWISQFVDPTGVVKHNVKLGSGSGWKFIFKNKRMATC